MLIFMIRYDLTICSSSLINIKQLMVQQWYNNAKQMMSESEDMSCPHGMSLLNGVIDTLWCL